MIDSIQTFFTVFQQNRLRSKYFECHVVNDQLISDLSFSMKRWFLESEIANEMKRFDIPLWKCRISRQVRPNCHKVWPSTVDVQK